MFDWIKDNPIFFVLIFLAIAAPQFFVGAMQVIIYIVCGVVVLFLILGLLLRAKIRRLQREAEQQMGGGQNFGGQNFGGAFYTNQRRTKSQDKEGDVNIFTQKGAGDKKVSRNVGDYVDFEEVKEKK